MHMTSDFKHIRRKIINIFFGNFHSDTLEKLLVLGSMDICIAAYQFRYTNL